jgi:hypothetical protein
MVVAGTLIAAACAPPPVETGSTTTTTATIQEPTGPMFSEFANVAAGVKGDAPTLVDVNGDDRLDIVIVPGGESTFYVVLNLEDENGDLTFTDLPGNPVGLPNDGINNVPTGLGTHDFNDDGLMDLYLTNQGQGNPGLRNRRQQTLPDGSFGFDLSPSNIRPGNNSRSTYRVAINNGDGTFGPGPDINADGDGNTRAAVFADFDGDGNTDLMMSNAPYYGIWWRSSNKPNQLRMGNPDGTFGDDVLQSAVVNDPNGALWVDALGRANTDYKGIVVRDFDGDGRPDIILSAFADVWDNVAVPPIATADPAGALVDLDGDGVGDGGYQGDWKRGVLVLRNVSTPGTVGFEDVSNQAIDNALGTTDQMHHYVTVPADIDGDGDLDLLASGPRIFFAEGSLERNTDRVRVYRNDSTPGSIEFTDITSAAGMDVMNDNGALAQLTGGRYPAELSGFMLDGSDLVLTPLLSSAAALDVDNDGDVDWVAIDRQLTSRNPLTNEEFAHWLFLNDGSGKFTAVQPEDHGMVHTARDLTYGDLNGDGRLDIVSVNGSGGGQTVDDKNYVWLNEIVNANHYVAIDVRLPGNYFGIGTKVTVFEAGTDTILGYEEVRTDFAYRSKRPARLHFGLGSVDVVDVRLTLPDGTETTYNDVPADQIHTFNPA